MSAGLTKSLLPCSALGHMEKVQRLALFLKTRGTLGENGVTLPKSREGVCQVCGHDLAVAFRLCDTNGEKVNWIEVAPGTPEAAEVERLRTPRIGEKGERIAAQLFPENVMIFGCYTCPEISDGTLMTEARQFNAGKPAATANNEPRDGEPLF